MADRRDAVVSNAKYLRNVRPIDPEEISEYVEGQPHPAVVRQLLREEAFDLDLVERSDGCFVPVDPEPVSPRRGPVEQLPGTYERAVEDLVADRYGPSWEDGPSGDLLRSTIRRFKAAYLDGRPVDYDEDVAAGYAIYHLPGYYAAVQYALDDLAETGELDRRLRVLDVGAGVGGPALGLCDYLPDDALVEYHAVEPSAAADVLDDLFDETGRNFHATIHRETAEAFEPAAIVDEADSSAADTTGSSEPDHTDSPPADRDGPRDADDLADGAAPASDSPGFDLVLFCNVLSELADPEAVLRRYLDALAHDGTLLAMAPADRETSIQLRDLERTVERGGTAAGRSVTVYGPTVRLWPHEQPSDRGWSFDVRPDLAVPTFQRRLDEAADDPDHEPGEFENVDVQFSYSLLRIDGTRRIDLSLDAGRWARMADMERHVPNRIDLVAAKLSRSLSEGPEANPLFKISDGSEAVDHYAVVTAETALNRPLLEAEYGDLLSFDGALALWNDDEEAYNLVVDEETVVDPAA